MKKIPFCIILLVQVFWMWDAIQAQPVRTGTIRAGNLQLYYESSGKGEALLLLHAGLQDHTMWAEQVKKFSARYEVITPDLPFHGKTIGTDTLTLAQDVIKTLLDSLHIQKVFVAGVSMGSGVALDFVIAYPERVNKVVLISAGLNGYLKQFSMDSVSAAYFPQFESALKNKDTMKAAAIFAKTWVEGPFRKAGSLNTPVSHFVYTVTFHNLQQHKMLGWPVLQEHPPAIERISSIRVPVLVIYGDRDIPFIVSTSLYLAKHIPGAGKVEIKDGAHMLNMEKPEQINQLLQNFFDSR